MPDKSDSDRPFKPYVPRSGQQPPPPAPQEQGQAGYGGAPSAGSGQPPSRQQYGQPTYQPPGYGGQPGGQPAGPSPRQPTTPPGVYGHRAPQQPPSGGYGPSYGAPGQYGQQQGYPHATGQYPVVSQPQRYPQQPGLDPRAAQSPQWDDDDEDYDDETGRPPWMPWALGVLAIFVVGIVVLSLLNSGGDKHEIAKAPSMEKGTLTKRWSSQEKVFVLDQVVISQIVVSIECQMPQTEGTPPGGCELVGRDIGSGERRWSVNDGPVGSTLAVVGNRVVGFGGERAIIVNPVDGTLIKTLAKGVLLGFSDNAAVFSEEPIPGQQSGARVVSVAVVDGGEFWQDVTPEGVSAWYSELRSQLATQVPVGFDFGTYNAAGSSSGYVAVPDIADSNYAIRRIDDGKIVLTSTPEAQVRGLVGDKALRVSTSGSRRRLEALDSGGTGSASWRATVTSRDTVAPCSGLVCVASKDGSTAILGSDDGKPIVRSAHRMAVRAAGNDVAIVRCGSSASKGDPCPLSNATLAVFSNDRGKTVWTGRVPSFATVSGAEDRQTLLVGSTTLKGTSTKSTKAVVFPDGQSAPVDLGSISGPGLTEPPTGAGSSGQLVSRQQCTVSGDDLLCGDRSQPSKIVNWRWQQN